MATALRFRLFRTGRYPLGWADAALAPDVLAAGEGVPVTSRFDGFRLPGRNTNSGVRKVVGSFVLTPQRVRASLGGLVVADSLLDDFATPDSVVALYLEPEGARIHVDISRLVPGGKGFTDFRFALPLEAGVLARVKALSCELHLDAVAAQQLSRRV